MSSLLNVGRLIWAPQALSPRHTALESRTKFRLAFWMAAIALGIQIAWLIPDDEIVRMDDKILEFWLNKLSGLAIGIVLMVVFWGFEVLLLGLMGRRGVSKAIRGSMVPFILLPAIAIPIHAWFPTGMSAMGYAWIVWVIIVAFMVWHGVWLALLLVQGYSGIETNEAVGSKTAFTLSGLLVLIELLIVVILFVYLPPLFQVSSAEFMDQWF